MNGDGWDDLVVLHKVAGTSLDNIWVFLSDGHQLAAPRLWQQVNGLSASPRYLFGDLDGDGYSNVILADVTGPPWAREVWYLGSSPQAGPGTSDLGGLRRMGKPVRRARICRVVHGRVSSTRR